MTAGLKTCNLADGPEVTDVAIKRTWADTANADTVIDDYVSDPKKDATLARLADINLHLLRIVISEHAPPQHLADNFTLIHTD